MFTLKFSTAKMFFLLNKVYLIYFLFIYIKLISVCLKIVHCNVDIFVLDYLAKVNIYIICMNICGF